MKTNRSCKTILAGLFAGALLCAQFTAQAIVVGPYTADPNTLHLWHMDSGAVPVPDEVVSGGTNLVRLANGAILGATSCSGFGTALDTLDGGQNGTVATAKDAYLTASSGTGTPGNIAITVADPTTGAFTMEALIWIGFDPTKNLSAHGGCQIINCDGANGYRIFQFRLDPIGTASGNTTVNLVFGNLHNADATPNQLISMPVPATGPDAIASNSWYHVAVVYNGDENTGDNISFYWTLLDASRTSANFIGSSSMQYDLLTLPFPFSVGNGPGRGAPLANFLGRIDEVRISKGTRGADQMMFAVPEPVITFQPVEQSVAAGESASFSVRATGAPQLFYQWRLYGTNLPGATASTYSIAAARDTDAGPYDVVVQNTYDTVTSSVAALTVGPAVTITSQPADQVLAVGQSTSLSVTADGAPTLLYQWRQSGTNVSGATQSVYAIASAKLTDSGPYDVVINNIYGWATSDVATVTVRIPLNLTWLGLAGSDWDSSLVSWVTDTSANVAYSQGDNVTFDVNGSGAPSVNLTGPLSPSSVVVDAVNDYTFSSTAGGGIVGVSRLTKSGAGTLVLDIDNSYNGPTLIQGGIVQLGAADGHGKLGTGSVTNNAALVVNRTGTISFTNALAGTGSVTNLLAATISISGTNILSGPIALNAGALKLAGPQAAGNSADFILNASANASGSTILQLSGGVAVGSGTTVSMLGTSADPDNRCTVNGSGDGSTNSLNGPLVLDGFGTCQFNPGSGELNLNGPISGSTFGGLMTLRGVAGVGHVYGTINLPNGRAGKTDGNPWVMHASGNTYTNFNVAAGTVRLAINNALATSGSLWVEGILDLGGFNQEVAGLGTTGPTTGIITNSSTTTPSTLTVNVAVPWVYSGVIKDAGGAGKVGLTLTGSSSLTLSGVSTYTGDTTISSGTTLALSGAGSLNSAQGSIKLAPGATFDVSAVTTAPYQLQAGKTLQGGGASGGATINGALSLSTGSFLALTYVSGTPALNVTGGALTLNGNPVAVTVSGAGLGAGSYKLISTDAGTGGSIAGTPASHATIIGSSLPANTFASLRLADGELWLDVVPRPVITSASYSGADLLLSGDNGVAGATCYVLTSTNVAAPLSTWQPVVTNVFDAGGPFSLTVLNAFSHDVPARFYLLQLP